MLKSEKVYKCFIQDCKHNSRLANRKIYLEAGWRLELNYNLGQKNCRFFYILAQFLFATSETELDYYPQKVNVRVTSRVAKRLTSWDIRKLGNFKKTPELLEFDDEYPASHPKAKS